MAILRVLVVEVKVPEVVGATSISIVLGMVILTVESRARVAVVSDSSAETGVGREGKRKAANSNAVLAPRMPVMRRLRLGVAMRRRRRFCQNLLAPLELVSNKCPPPPKLIFAHARTLEL